MKTKVLKFLQNLPKNPIQQFNKALKIFQKCDGYSFTQVRYLNAAGFTKYNLQNLLYDLQQVVGITDKDIRAAKPKVFPKVNPYAIPVFAKGPAGNMARQKFVKAKGIEVEGRSNKAMDPAIKKWSKEMTEKAKEEKKLKKEAKSKNDVDNTGTGDEIVVTTKAEVFKNAPDEVKEYISLHDEFPYLDEDDCPEELKILVADKRKHYRKYVDAHDKLLVIISPVKDEAPVHMSNEEIFELAIKAVDNFEVNQAIYAELDYYKLEGNILGHHPIFLQRKLKDKIDGMTMADAAKRESNLDNYIRRDGKALDKAVADKNENEIKKLEEKIEGWKIELGLVNAKLGVSAK